jgi:hypothetical protein
LTVVSTINKYEKGGCWQGLAADLEQRDAQIAAIGGSERAAYRAQRQLVTKTPVIEGGYWGSKIVHLWMLRCSNRLLYSA